MAEKRCVPVPRVSVKRHCQEIIEPSGRRGRRRGGGGAAALMNVQLQEVIDPSTKRVGTILQEGAWRILGFDDAKGFLRGLVPTSLLGQSGSGVC